MEKYTTQRLTESSWDNKEWICSICGRQNKEEFKYCPECGEKKPDHEETQTEITIKKLKRKGFENCEQLFRLLIHVEDEEGNLLGSYNMTLHGYATKQELLNLLGDYLGYKENYPAPYKEYHLEIQDWPYHSLDSVYGIKEDFHVCELYSNEWNAVRKEYSERETAYEETWEEIRMKRKAYEQKYKVLVHLEDEEGNLLENYNVTLYGHDTEKELIDLLEDHWGYNKGVYKEYYLEVIDWPHNPGPSQWCTGSSLHVCEMEEREFRVIRRKYKKDIERPMESMYFLYGCPNSRDIEEKKEVETKIEIVYF